MNMDYLHHDFIIVEDYFYVLRTGNRTLMRVNGFSFDLLWLKYYEYTSLKSYPQISISEIDFNGNEKKVIDWSM